MRDNLIVFDCAGEERTGRYADGRRALTLTASTAAAAQRLR
jgi:hypothetical protein